MRSGFEEVRKAVNEIKERDNQARIRNELTRKIVEDLKEKNSRND